AAKRTVIEAYEAKQAGKDHEAKIAAAAELLGSQPLAPREYDDCAVRQLIDTIRVIDKDRIKITFKGGMEIEQRIEAQ
ncbi:MAG: hypothetical protein LBL26_11190, partial [Peptococcaceae bacterium]|nr:hypothetical protein [Peptococcaceae bacterium]